MKILLFGDENFSFTPGYLASHPNAEVEVASCVEEDQLREDVKPSLELLKEKKVKIYYGINPAQMKQKFGEEIYDLLVYILPGIAFHGCPEFIDTKGEMFKLRLHLFCFGFLKSAKPSLKTNGTIMFLLPNFSEEGLPFARIEPDKLARFCCIRKLTMEPFESSFFGTWKPIIHNYVKPVIPDWLMRAQYYCFRIDQEAKEEKRTKKRKLPSVGTGKSYEYEENSSLAAKSKGGVGDSLDYDDGVSPDDYNVLKIPPQVFEYDREQLPHVNECFHFKLWGRGGTAYLISKLTLKYDPRISGWKGDGTTSTRGPRDPSGRMMKGYGPAGRPGVPPGIYGAVAGMNGPPPPPPGPTGYYLSNGGGAIPITPAVAGQYAAAVPGGLGVYGFQPAAGMAAPAPRGWSLPNSLGPQHPHAPVAVSAPGGNRPAFPLAPGARLAASTSAAGTAATASANKRLTPDAASSKAAPKRPRSANIPPSGYPAGYPEMPGMQMVYAAPSASSAADSGLYATSAVGAEAYQYGAYSAPPAAADLNYGQAALSGYTDIYGNYLPAGYEMYAAASFPAGYEDYYNQAQSYGVGPGVGYYDVSALGTAQAGGYDINYLPMDGKSQNTGAVRAQYSTSSSGTVTAVSHPSQSKPTAAPTSAGNFSNPSYNQYGHY